MQSYLVTGAETFLAERACQRIVREARAADAGVERHDIVASSESAASALLQACGPTLFGDGAVVLLDGIEDAADDVQRVVHELGTLGDQLEQAIASSDDAL